MNDPQISYQYWNGREDKRFRLFMQESGIDDDY
jgi:hypothetical protein